MTSGHDDEEESGLDEPSPASPFEPPPNPEPNKPTNIDPSVFAEPWMKAELHPEDVRDPGPALPLTDKVSEDQSVWDEPGLSKELAGDTPADGVTWFRWYRTQVARTSVSSSWTVSLLIAAIGGVFAVIGTLIQQTMPGGLLGVTVFGPTVEEIMKIALPLWLVEKRPWLYRHAGQILICATASGLAFAAIENVLYLKVYIDDPPASLVMWRWTVCVLLHSGCSTVAGLGVWKIWRRFQEQQRAPALADGAPFIVAAIVLHGLYNGTVTILELGGLDF